ncbi:hypothetical protein ACF1CG_05940 [Streptomyces sp. NPDC014773]|uniref:hypothetical protein n=1 Tax=Streptomyces sp. NPDC014773 TaxID=3364908 RepID=UPI0037033DFC
MRPVILHSLVHTTDRPGIRHWGPERITAAMARKCLRMGHQVADAVTVYETTDRDGNAVRVVHVHYGPRRWSRVLFVTDIYEIPAAALTDI